MSKQLLFFVRNYNLNEDAPKNSNYAAASIGAPTRAQVFRYDVKLDWHGGFFENVSGGTQRIVSVEYLFGRPVIASNFRLRKCHLELS